MGVAVLDLPASATYQGSGGRYIPHKQVIAYQFDEDSDIQSRFSYSSGGQVIWRYTETGSGGLLFSVSAQEAQTKAEQNHAALLVDKVQSTFNLTVDETAKVCGVSRKTVYNWKDGDQPNKAKFRRLMLISMIADAWRKSDLPVTRNVMEQPIIGTQTILELLAQTDVNQDKILFAGNRIKMDLIAQAQTIEDPFA